MNTDDNYFNEVCRFIDEQQVLDQSCVECLDLQLDLLNLDSLELVDLSLQLEKKFNKRINFESMSTSSTLRDLILGLTDA